MEAAAGLRRLSRVRALRGRVPRVPVRKRAVADTVTTKLPVTWKKRTSKRCAWRPATHAITEKPTGRIAMISAVV